MDEGTDASEILENRVFPLRRGKYFLFRSFSTIFNLIETVKKIFIVNFF